jgi:hypothetical protein
MNQKAQLVPKLPGNEFVDARLKKLRRERYLVQRAILVLTSIARTRQVRDRRASRN